MELLHSHRYLFLPRVTCCKPGIKICVRHKHMSVCVCTWTCTSSGLLTDIRESYLNIFWKLCTQTHVLSNTFSLTARAVLHQDSPQWQSKQL